MKTSHSLLALCLASLSQQAAAVSCTNLESWLANKTYNGGATVQHEQKAYKANWWNQNKNPAQYSNPYQEWTKQGDCDAVVVNQPPQVTLTAPAAGSNHSTGVAVTLSANASDADGTISKVEFYVDNQLAGSDSSAPYSLNWTAVAGNHSVYAKATDDKAATSQTAPVSFTVSAGNNQLPTVSITAPANNANLNAGETVLLSANASDADGSVAKVQFVLNGTVIAEKTAAPYSSSWTAVAGNQQLTVRVIDNLGGQSEASIMFSVTSSPTGHAACRPDGLYQTPGLDVPYCTIYDQQGREKMGADHPRRIIGYFTSWRTGKNGQPSR